MSVIEFLQLSEAIRLMLELDYEPRADRFIECSVEQRQALADEGYETSRRWFVMSRSASEPSNDPLAVVRLVDETERDAIVGAAVGIIEETDASGQTFTSFRERVEHVSNQMPEIVWKQGGPSPRPRVLATVPGPT